MCLLLAGRRLFWLFVAITGFFVCAEVAGDLFANQTQWVIWVLAAGAGIIGAVLAVVEIIGILLAVDAVMRPRSSQAAIAWSIALITLPVVTIPLYLIFGRTRFRGYQTALQEKEALVGERLAD